MEEATKVDVDGNTIAHEKSHHRPIEWQNQAHIDGQDPHQCGRQQEQNSEGDE